MSKLTKCLDGLPAAISSLGSENFIAALLTFIRNSADFDSAVIMAYPLDGALNVIYNALHPGDLQGFSNAYRKGLWLFSPLYLSAKAGQRGFYPILDLAPENFQKSDYYELYYRSNGVVDQAVYIVESGDNTPLAISLERTSALTPFNVREKKALAVIADTVAALVQQHWPHSPAKGEAQETGLHRQVQAVFQAFGSSLLTPRERDVVQLLLKGYSSKAAAKTLGISSQTEQVHRKNIYQKLGLSSHNELFSLFFDALVQAAPGSDDPLAAVLARPRST